MSDRPILFSGPMVRAILSGAKTQTRRIVKRENQPDPGSWWRPCLCREIDPKDAPCVVCDARFGACPYGGPGDRLCVCETWGYRGASWTNADPTRNVVTIAYQADDSRQEIDRFGPSWDVGLPKQHPPPMPKNEEDWEAIEAYDAYFPRYWRSWRPSIHMPRWASRITLDVLSVRVERLHEISEEDAKAEGVEPEIGLDTASGDAHRNAFSRLWESINGPESWDANPWVWRIEFKRAEGSR